MSFVHNSLSLLNKLRSLSRVLHCDKTRRAFENSREMYKTRAAGECFLHFSSVLKCPECFIYGLETVVSVLFSNTRMRLLYNEREIFNTARSEAECSIENFECTVSKCVLTVSNLLIFNLSSLLVIDLQWLPARTLHSFYALL